MKRALPFLIFFVAIFFAVVFGVFFYIEQSLAPVTNKAATDGKELSPLTGDFEELNYIEGEVIVKYKEDRIDLDNKISSIRLWGLHKEFDLITLDRTETVNTELVSANSTTEELIGELVNDPNVESAQPNYQYKTLKINTNDTHKDELWGLHNEGTVVDEEQAKNDADIDAPEAWNISKNNNEVVVAVIDTGVAYNYRELKEIMWDGSKCKNENGVYLGNCIHGYDYEYSDKDPMVGVNSHGTHIAGTIAAVGNNGEGIVGVASNVKIMALKTRLTTNELVKAIKFADVNGAKIINASWGGYYNDNVLSETIRNYSGLFIASAGNSGYNHADIAVYPCDYGHENIVCVAATDQQDQLANFGPYAGSDYGLETVDIAAPGKNIFSTVATKEVYAEDLQTVRDGELPSGWTKSQFSNWSVAKSFFIGNWIWSDLSTTGYSPNANTILTSDVINLKNKTANLSFASVCDTADDYNSNLMTDFVTLQFSSDGVNFENIPFPYSPHNSFSWDERMLDILQGEEDAEGLAYYEFEAIQIPVKFATEQFRYRFTWKTDGDLNENLSCGVGYFQVNEIATGESGYYEFYDGTSMASPHVAGVAGLILGEKNLPVTKVKSILQETGDSLPSLTGKTVTGKRVNAHKAVLEAQVSDENEPTPTTPIGGIACGRADTNNDGKFTILDLQQFSVIYGRGLSKCNDSSQNFGVCGGRDVNKDANLNIIDFGGPQGFAKRYTPRDCNL